MGSIPQLSVLKGPQRTLVPAYLHKMFEQRVANGCGDKTAMIYNDIDGNEQITNYKTMNATANRYASFIQHQIVDVNKLSPNQDGDWIVAVCMMPTDNLIQILLAIWKAGGAYLPLDPSFPINRIQHILDEAKPVLVIYDAKANRTAFGNTPSISIDTLNKNSEFFSTSNIPIEANLSNGENNLGLVLYTSGSTGIPKGVRLSHSIVLNRLQWQWERFPYSDTEKTGVFKTALTFVDSVSELWGPLLNDMAVLVVEKSVTQNPERLVEVLQRYKIERLVLVPSLLRSLLMYLPLQNQSDLLDNLKIWICSGETLSLTLAKEFFDYFKAGKHILCNFYGSTEVMGDVTYFVCESKNQLDSFDKVPIGVPVNNTVVYLLDNNYRPVKTGQIGELFVSGLNLANGYVNGRDPDRFIENLLAIDPNYDRLYRTGDYASIEKDTIMYEGRTDSQIKIRGHRVDLSEVEKCMLSMAGVEKGVVLCYHAGEIDQALVGFVTGDHQLISNGIQVEQNLRSKLADYMIPQVIVVDAIPLLVNGKMDRQSLLKMYENTNNNEDSEISIDYDYEGVPEQQMHEAQTLFETIGHDVLGRSIRTTIRLSSNFYELGGNSLNSIFAVTQLREKGFHISITDFISAKSLGEILAKIMCHRQSGGTPQNCHIDAEPKFESTLLTMEDKSDTIDIITSSFFEKADLEQWLKPNINEADYKDIIETIWNVLVEKELSFIVKDKNARTVGVALNFDAHDEPEVHVTSQLAIVFDFLESIEGPIRDNVLPSGIGKILHSFMMGTNADLGAQENIEVMQFMEEEVLSLGKRRKFTGIFTTNTNPLTQQLGADVYGYECMLEYQVNRYEMPNGERPFAQAPDTQLAIVHWKNITGFD